MDRERDVCRAQRTDEVIIPRFDCSLGGIHSVVVWFDKLELAFLGEVRNDEIIFVARLSIILTFI